MLSPLFESLRTTTETTTRTQRDIMDQSLQRQRPFGTGAGEGAAEGEGSVQERWNEFVKTTLVRQRALLDSAFQSGAQLLEQTATLSDAKTKEEWRRLTMELWWRLFDVVKTQSETQLDELLRASRFWSETAKR